MYGVCRVGYFTKLIPTGVDRQQQHRVNSYRAAYVVDSERRRRSACSDSA